MLFINNLSAHHNLEIVELQHLGSQQWMKFFRFSDDEYIPIYLLHF